MLNNYKKGVIERGWVIYFADYFWAHLAFCSVSFNLLIGEDLAASRGASTSHSNAQWGGGGRKVQFNVS